MHAQKRMNEDIEFLKRPSDWPQWPLCPVKRYVEGESFPVVGVVTSNLWPDEASTVVVEVNMFLLPLSKEEYDARPKHEYNSIEELVADGWMVD